MYTLETFTEMDRKTKVLVGGVGIVVLIAILATTTMGSATEFVEPTDLDESDDHDGDIVKLEGRVVNLEGGDRITFDVADENHTVAVSYDGEMPETMSEGRLAVAEGHFDGESLEASDLTVRAHEGDENGHDHGEDYDEYEEYDYEKADSNATHDEE